MKATDDLAFELATTSNLRILKMVDKLLKKL